MSGKLRWSVIILTILFVVMQFVARPAKTNPTIDRSKSIEANTHMTPEVASIFERSCNDCHSNHTRWPWYSHVAPVSWFVTDHVNHGRKHLNFSEWPQDREQADYRLREICGEVKHGMMPLASYEVIHRHAKLSSDDVKTICDWTRAERERLAQEETGAN